MYLFRFIWQLDDTRIVQAIRTAERRSSVEIRVHVCDCPVTDPVAAARFTFEEMEMTATKLRNAVLIFVAPRSDKLAVVGDIGFSGVIDDLFWTDLVAQMLKLLPDCPTEAIVQGIRHLGRTMAQPFPRRANDVNELPDEVNRFG